MPSQQQKQQVVVGSTTRWCPTPEQLTILEEIYRGGLRTPKSSQIQQITAHLACYGRIECKNVFYWFQNHKARDRQKLRRRLCMSHHLLSWAQQYYAAAAHHGAHGHHRAGFLAPTPSTVAPYGHQLLSPSTTSPTPAAAAAAAYGYYYPTTAAAFAAAAAPPASPTTQLFHHQGGEGGGLVSAEALGRPEYSSLGKLDNFGVVTIDDVVVSSTAAAIDMTPPGFEVVPAPAPAAAFCRPLKTLDLFPGGLKEEQHDVA